MNGIVSLDTVGQSPNAKARVWQNRHGAWFWEWRDWVGGDRIGFDTEKEARKDMERIIAREAAAA